MINEMKRFLVYGNLCAKKLDKLILDGYKLGHMLTSPMRKLHGWVVNNVSPGLTADVNHLGCPGIPGHLQASLPAPLYVCTIGRGGSAGAESNVDSRS